ncbi:MAG: acetyl-CoA carboxylase biotin carboxylase subunit, partial [Aggregatilineales bacterium]
MLSLKKCLIANRGEIAVRIIRACRELNINTVAIYSDADATALHVQMADEAIYIGAAPARESYLNIEKIIAAARDSGADCIHPGYGFLSESADFARVINDAGLTWVGPGAAAIDAMGSKTEARALMASANVPIVPGFQSDSASDDDFVNAATDIGYPVMVKASGGGGGRGIRVVYEPDNLQEALQSARSEAQNAFGDARIFLEKYIERGRHIEIQILADTHGNTLHLYERECSTQRRHQKIIEESPSVLLDDATRTAMGQAAVNAAKAVNYVNAGTVEFIATEDGAFYFLEMNTRLQVEHPVTELVTGIDLVQWQFRIAAGDAISFTQDDIQQQGHAIECRIYAEDARNQFLPATGTLHVFETPAAPGVRVDTGVQSGDSISIHYDPMIAKLIVHAESRADAITRMKQALMEMMLPGTITNIDFLQALLEHPAFVNGTIDTTFVDANLENLLPDIPEPDDMALIMAALLDFTGQSNQVPGEQGDGQG